VIDETRCERSTYGERRHDKRAGEKATRVEGEKRPFRVPGRAGIFGAPLSPAVSSCRSADPEREFHPVSLHRYPPLPAQPAAGSLRGDEWNMPIPKVYIGESSPVMFLPG